LDIRSEIRHLANNIICHLAAGMYRRKQFTILPGSNMMSSSGSRIPEIMSREFQPTPEDFERLLLWLDGNRAKAADLYEEIRSKLITVLSVRGCPFPEDATDETIDRVIRKLPEIINTYVGAPEAYFYGVAINVCREYLRKSTVPLPDAPLPAPTPSTYDARYDCLEKCLDRLPASSRELVIAYYQFDGKKKIECRNGLARQLGLAASGLRVRAHRIRQVLQRCVGECLNGREQKVH
jgi:DNA-directed RNA polymerase specialized sigma24 family protein